MKHKQIQRTCSACQTVRYVDPSFKNIKKIPPAISDLRSAFTTLNVQKRSDDRKIAMLVLSCQNCGSTSYKDKDVRI